MTARAPLRALVLGSADTLDADRAAALELFTPDLIIACNQAAIEAPHVDASVTMHPDIRDRLWLKERERKGLPPAGQLWHPRHRGNWPNSKPIESWGGSSGMLCITVAFELQCTHIVVCGVPLLPNHCHFNEPGKRWNEARQYHPVWKRLYPRIKDRVRSQSGFTRDLLGAATQEWIDGDTT